MLPGAGPEAVEGDRYDGPTMGDTPSGVSTVEAEQRFLNRELSWLEFGDRLLDLASDPSQPLLERVKFLAIFSEGLDEFFQVRVAKLEDQVAAGVAYRTSDGMLPRDQLAAISERAGGLVARQGRIFLEEVVPALAAAGIVLSEWHSLEEDDRHYLVDVFQRQIFPVLTPLAMDPGHPFPYISNLSLNLMVRVTDPVSGASRIARVKVPPVLPRFVVLPDGERFVPLEQVIAAHLDTLFPSMTIGEHYAFRVTRNADLSVEEDEADDLPAAVEMELQRRRFGEAVRLEVASDCTDEFRDILVEEVGIPPESVYELDVPVDLGGLWAVVGLDRPDLAAGPWDPVTPPELTPGVVHDGGPAPIDGSGSVLDALGHGEILLHHPYDSYDRSVEAFIDQAAADPQVLAIKQTLYRTSGKSPIVSALIRASEAGKQVAVVVELQAPFDERANIGWARALEAAGVEVVYGLQGLKTHAKMALVARQEADGIHRYCHVSTGNYNERTALGYEDLGLLSGDPVLTADVAALFNYVTGFGQPAEFRRLVVAPMALRRRIIAWIDGEADAGPDGRIVLKVNGLTDPEVIDALYRASRAGTSVDVIVRSRCCLRPGVPGLSEHIRVRSVVDRFLEHSRVFSFGGTAGRPLTVAIGSADLMERSLDRRVEAVVPVEDDVLRRRLVEVLDLAVADDTNAWELGPDGRWTRVPTVRGINLQRRLRHQALERQPVSPPPPPPPTPPAPPREVRAATPVVVPSTAGSTPVRAPATTSLLPPVPPPSPSSVPSVLSVPSVPPVPSVAPRPPQPATSDRTEELTPVRRSWWRRLVDRLRGQT